MLKFGWLCIPGGQRRESGGVWRRTLENVTSAAGLGTECAGCRSPERQLSIRPDLAMFYSVYCIIWQILINQRVDQGGFETSVPQLRYFSTKLITLFEAVLAS